MALTEASNETLVARLEVEKRRVARIVVLMENFIAVGGTRSLMFHDTELVGYRGLLWLLIEALGNGNREQWRISRPLYIPSSVQEPP